MIALLLASSVAAALVPIPEPPAERPAKAASPEPQASDRLLDETLSAGAAKPAVIRAAVSDRLALTVISRRYDRVEIVGLGQLEDVAPGSSARFDLRFTEPGRYPVRLVDTDRPVGRIEVTAARADGP